MQSRISRLDQRVQCPATPLQCPAYASLVTGAIVDELRVIFLGAAICAGVAAVLALTLLGGSSLGELRRGNA